MNMSTLRIAVLTSAVISAALPMLHVESPAGSAVLTRATIESINASISQVTIQTSDGHTLTLQAVSKELLDGLNKGDTCTFELDPDDRIVKIVKLGVEKESAPAGGG